MYQGYPINERTYTYWFTYYPLQDDTQEIVMKPWNKTNLLSDMHLMYEIYGSQLTRAYKLKG